MDNFVKVQLRKSKELKEVKITASDKPSINESTISKWQNIINIISSLINVPSGLIMKITNDSMEVFVSSDTKENSYQVGDSDHLGHGLFCETVIGEDKPLHVDNALKDKVWKDNPDVSLNMISYYGLPLKWSDGEFFGTICVLDDKINEFSQLYKDLMSEFRNAIESHLKVLEDKRNHWI